MRNRYAALAGAAAILALPVGASAAPGSKAGHAGKTAIAGSASEPRPAFGPVPDWVQEQDVPEPDPKHKDDPFRFLLSSSQETLGAQGLENFVEYVVQPLNQAGLQAIGNVVVPWNVDRTDITLNRVSIERDGKVIDALDREDVSVIRRETKLEQSTFTGIRTVVMPVRGLQVGDLLRVAITYKTKPGAVGRTEEVHDFAVPLAMGRLVRRFLVDKDLPVKWSIAPGLKEASSKIVGEKLERVFVADRLEPEKERSYVPGRFKHRLIQVSAFETWDDVAAILVPKFDQARRTVEGSDVAKLAEKISSAHHDARGRMLAALRAVQDDVRYVAILLGDGDYTPMSADEVWAQRYGDCKGKTALMLALLDRLGVKAEPVLASIGYDDAIGRQLPTLAMFDHVYVRAHIGPETYYLDGTQFGQRTLEELKQSTTLHVLPLTTGSELLTVPDVLPTAPLIETGIVWDASKGILDAVPFEATLTLRGEAAAEARQETANSTDREKLLDKFKNKVAGIQNDALEYVSTEAEAADGSFLVRFKGSVDLDWTPVDGLKGNRLQLTQSTLTWNGEFDRDDDAGKTIPVAMAFPYWERTIEKVILPEGGRNFTIDAPAVDQTVAATRLSRTVTMENGVVTAISDFKRLQRELDAETARNAKPELEKIGGSYAYVVSRKKLRLPK